MSSVQDFAQKYNFDTIPNELKRLDHWLGFKLLPKDNGKFRKAPFNTHFDSPFVHESNSDAWMTFAEAVRQYEAGLCEGIGFSLIDTPYLVFDYDNQIKWIDNNYSMSIYLTEGMNKLCSWAEMSCSGTGAHIWTVGRKVAEKTKFEWGELLGDNPKQGFVAMTGIMLPNSPKEIYNKQEEINAYFMTKQETKFHFNKAYGGDYTDDEVLKRKMFSNNPKIEQFWSYKPNSNDDWSSLDQSLMNHLAFWTNKDADRMFRMFKTTNLYRGEGVAHANKTRNDKYYKDAIAKAISTSRGGFTAEQPIEYSNGENAVDESDIPTVEEVKTIIESKQTFDEFGMPLLPKEAMIDYSLGENVCLWLKDYMNFSRKCEPRAYETFHIMSGLWILSTIAAGRLESERAKTTILNFMAVGKSGCRKTRTTALAPVVLQKAGLTDLIHIGNFTPQLLTQKMAEDKEFAGQKGWYFDEFGSFLSKIMNESSAWHDYIELVRVIYGGVESFNTGTIGRGEKLITKPYLSILGTITTDELIDKKLGNFWSNGLFARVMFFYAPMSYKPEKLRNPVEFMDIPGYLTNPLKQWHQRLMETSKANLLNITRIKVTSECDNAFYNYLDALEDLNNETINKDLQSSYQRFGEFAARIALLFASIDNASSVELKHWAKAQQITELYRQSLHMMYSEVAKPTSSKRVVLEEKITKLLQGKAEALSLAGIKKFLNLKNESTEFLLTTLETLERAQVIESVKAQKVTKYQIFYDVATA